MIARYHLIKAETFAWSIIDYMLMILASCTLAYEIILFKQLPLWFLYPFFVFFFIVLLLFKKYRETNSDHKPFEIDKITVGLISLGIICFLINTFTLRPDADDFSYLHRAVFNLLDEKSPLSLYHTAHDLKALPAISPVHLTASIEVSSVLLANTFGLEPISFVHNYIGGICLFIFPFILYVFFQHLGFSDKESLIGILITLLLYIFSGDSHRDWGNFTIVRAWQGKTILTLLFVPLSSLLTFRFLCLGSKEDLLRLNLAAISGIGLSGSAFFLFPFIVGFSILGSVPYQFRQPFFFRRMFLLGTVLIPFILIAILIKTGALPDTPNTEVWGLQLYGLATQGRAELISLTRTVFATKTTLWFYLISISGIFLLYGKNRRLLQFTTSTVLVCVALILPPFSSILIQITLPAAYWRLAYASQMPFIISIFILLSGMGSRKKELFPNTSKIFPLSQSETLPRNVNFNNKLDWEIQRRQSFQVKVKKISQRVFAVCIFAGFVFLKTSAINSNTISKPHEWKFNSNQVEAGKIVKNWAPRNVVALIPENLVVSIGLIRPDIQMLSTRSLETLHVFLNAGRKKEGESRIAAQRDLLFCGREGRIKTIIEKNRALSLIIFPKKCNQKMIQHNLGIDAMDWEIKQTSNYQFWSKNVTD